MSLAKEGKLADTVGLRFYSPTAFRLGNSGLNLPLPLPEQVFQSLLQKWDRFAPVPLELNREELKHHLGVARHSLKTRMLDFGTYKQVGFIGNCWFLMDGKTGQPSRQVLHTLADFAFYAGVGRKTTMGMGQVRRIS